MGWTKSPDWQEHVMADEIELKIALSRADADAVEASELLRADPAITKLKAIYFDTPGRDLAMAGLSLRIRRSDRRRIQTIKASGAAAGGLFVRPEWERRVTDDTPVLDDTTPIPGLLGKRAAEIAPRFTIDVERRTWTIDQGGAEIELALDRGEAHAGERSSPICEIELELKSGEPAALFTLARRIGLVSPGRLGVLTKAERGDRLTQPAATQFKAEPVVLAPVLSAAQGFQHIVSACIRQYRLNEDLLFVDRNAGALHQGRIALRRLRSAFVIFKPAIAGTEQQRLRAELRWLAAEMGDARNLDVLLERVRDDPLRKRLETARDAAYERVESAIHSPRARALMLDLAEWTAGGEWLAEAGTEIERNRPIEKFAADALDRLRRRVKKGGRNLADLADEARHEVRKDAKKLRYAAEFFKSLYRDKRERRRFKRFSGVLETLQDQLGALNDLATAPHVLETLGLVDDPASAEVLAKGRKAQLRHDAEEAYEDLVDARRFWR